VIFWLTFQYIIFDMETDNLTTLKEQESGFVVKVGGSLHLKRRLLDLGFTEGTLVRIINISPLKNSYLVELHGYIIALRNNAVKCVEVVKADV
ncbi:MAG: ferrous iron transport protein A, partial [Clostridiales bacterium]|nr:ferrous iron transport protein A [Candidatus Apopatousia equi]